MNGAPIKKYRIIMVFTQRERDTRGDSEQRKCYLRTQGEGSPLKAKERREGSEESNMWTF